MDQISFSITNGSATNTIYMPASDPGVNQIKVLISASTTLSLVAATPVPESEAGDADGTLLYLHLGGLGLSTSSLNDLEVSLAGWDAKVFADTQVICLAPRQNGTLAQGQNLTVSVASFTSAKAPSGSTAQLYISCYRALPVSSGALPFSYSTIVALQAPPSAQLDLHDAMQVSLKSSTLVQSSSDYPAIANTLNLTFGPGDNPKNVVAGPDTVFTINFVYANDAYGYGALATLDEAFAIAVNPADGALAWTVTAPPKGSQNPGWMLQPPDGQPILGAGSAGFVLANIVTRFQAGATLMLVSYSGVPGYQDGTFTLVLNKEAHVYIHSFDASPNPAVLAQGEATIALAWNATGRLTLMPGRIDVTGTSSFVAKIGEPTQFTLIAQGDSTANYASRDVQAEILPVINSIAASPQLVYHTDFPHDVLLDWSVNSNDEVRLTSSVNANPQLLPPNYTTAVAISQPQCFCLAPKNNLPLNIERKEVVSAFQMQQQGVSLSGKPLALAVSPRANICALILKGSSQVQVMETITNTLYGNPVSAGSQPVALAFAPDGSRLFVANAGDSTMSVFQVSAGSGGYNFTRLGDDVRLSGVPAALQVSADGTEVFVTSNGSGAKPGVLDVVSAGQSGFAVSSSLRLPKQVGNLAVLPSAAQVYIASQQGQAVYVAGYDSLHKTYQLVRTIAGFDSGDSIQDVAIAAQDSGTLLIACAGTNRVYAVDRHLSSVAGTQRIAVGKSPARLLVTQGGAYAYVANHGDSSISLISCFKGAGLCTLLEQGLANGAAPVAMSASTEGSLVYVANDAAGLSVWSSQTQVPQGSVLSVTLPTSVAASERYVVTWHNYNIQFTIKGKAPTPGLSVYDRDTEASSVVNDSVQYTTFAFWPEGGRQLAIASVVGDNNLYMLDTTDFSTKAKVAFSDSATCRAISTAVSRFGNMIFVLTSDTGGAYQLAAISCNLDQGTYRLVSTVKLFTQAASSSHALVAVSDGSRAFITDAAGGRLYVVARQKGGGYALEADTYSFPAMPRAMSCAPDDTQLYVWMNQGQVSGFARFDIAAQTLQNFILPSTVAFQISGMAISPDGARLYVADTNAGVRVFSTDAMQNVENIVLSGASFPMGVAVAPDGSGVFTANALSDNMSMALQLPASASLRGRFSSASEGASYQGIFLRDYKGQTPGSNNGSGWTLSPDIIPWGPQQMPNPSDLGQQANYNTDYANNIVLGEYNNVYVRGLNTNAGAQKSRVYFYWVDMSIILLPSQWSPYNFKFDLNLQNWLDISAAKQGDIAYSAAPLNWQPSAAYPHYCLVAWVDNSATPSPPDLSSFSNFKDWNDLGNFIMAHPNMCWRNTNDVSAPAGFMNAQSRVSGVKDGGQVTVGVMLGNIPTDKKRKIQFNLVNSNGTIVYNSPVHEVDTNTFSQTLDWPANAPDPVLTYTYVPDDGKLAGNETITAFSSFLPPLPLRKRLLLRAPHLMVEVNDRKLGGRTEMLLGTVRFRYTGK